MRITIGPSALAIVVGGGLLGLYFEQDVRKEIMFFDSNAQDNSVFLYESFSMGLIRGSRQRNQPNKLTTEKAKLFFDNSYM